MTETGTAGARMRRPVEQEEVSAQSSEEGAQPRPQPGLRRQPPGRGAHPPAVFSQSGCLVSAAPGHSRNVVSNQSSSMWSSM